MTWWDDFSNNLATDLAPFVSLFGENPTKQYLSECLTVVDAIIFAIAPLGVITAIVSVIRVCGPPSLRAFIGRAQEGAGTAEAELCSSTSRDVCELYNNGGIARVFGRPKILEFVHDRLDSREDLISRTVFGDKPFEEKWGVGIYLFKDHIKDRADGEWLKEVGSKRVALNNPDIPPDFLGEFPPNPNLTINIGISTLPPWVSLAIAVIGTLLQLGVLLWAGVARYKFEWTRGDVQDRYALPTLVIGTALLTAGIMVCAVLINGTTKEQVFHRTTTTDARSRLYWVQPGTQFVGDQAFDSFAFSHPHNQLTRYISSWKASRQPPKTVPVCACIAATIVGFILQFLGLRACHSSVAVAQLGLMLAMSTARSSLRSNRLAGRDVDLVEAPDLYAGYELDWVALCIGYMDRSDLRRYWYIPNSALAFEELTATSERIHHGEISYISWSNNSTPLLSGFISHRSPSKGFWQQAERWRFNQYFPWKDAKETVQSPQPANLMDDSASVFIYRARLAYLTQDWGDQLVKPRAMARALALTIDATMKVFFNTDAVLQAGWNEASRIYWSFPCAVAEIQAAKRRMPGTESPPILSASPRWNPQPSRHVHLTLRRPDPSRKPAASDPWTADALELEAVLGLITWSRQVLFPSGEEPPSVYRVVELRRYDSEAGIRPEKHLDFWGGRIALETRPLAMLLDPGESEGVLFGTHHIPESLRGPKANDGVAHVRRITLYEHTVFQFFAQEIYSIFFTSMLHAVKDIRGETRNVGDTLVNSSISQIQRAFTDHGLGTAEDALDCIFPALVNQGKLPR